MRAGGAEKAQKGYGTLSSFGRDIDFSGHDRASGSMSRHGSQAINGC